MPNRHRIPTDDVILSNVTRGTVFGTVLDRSQVDERRFYQKSPVKDLRDATLQYDRETHGGFDV